MANKWIELTPDRMSYQAGYRWCRLKEDESGWEFSKVDPRKAALDEMVRLTEEMGLYDEADK